MLALLALTLVACGEEKAADSAAPVAELAVPWIAVTAATAPDYLKSSCLIAVDRFDAGSETSLDHRETFARGGEWAAIEVPLETLTTATGSWRECLNNDLGTGQFRSGTFSAQAGDLFVFRYVGTSAAFLTLVQGEDHEGGVVDVKFAEGVVQADVEDLAATWGASVAPSETTYAGGFELRWLQDTNVAEVLAALSQDERYVEGAPRWVRPPAGW